MHKIKVNKDWKAVVKRYSFIAHFFVALSVAITPLVDFIPIWAIFIIALLGLIGSFLKQEINEKEEEDDVS